MKTYSTRASDIRRTWHVLDAAGVPLGRLATHAATLIRGKHKVIYAPHLDTGDYVVVVNASNVVLTGRKQEQKRYYSHSQYPSGLKVRSVREVTEKNPARVVEHAVHGMLPHNALGRSLHGHLRVYPGPIHPHQAQVNGPEQPALSQPPTMPRTRSKPARGRAATAPVASPAGTALTPVMDMPGPVQATETEAVPEAVVAPAVAPIAETVTETEETGA